MLTAIEKLEPDYPGLLRELDSLFRRGFPATQIRSLVLKKFGRTVPVAQIWKYRTKRWIPSMRRVERDAERWQAMIQVLKREFKSLPEQSSSWWRKDLPKLIAFLAQALYGPDWRVALQERLIKRLHAENISELTPAQARGEIESLFSRLALTTNESRGAVWGLISEEFYVKNHD